jgi:nucleoside-diphosphate-sugar epimerase
MKKVFLTGAAGFIGRHTIPFLLDKGYEIHAVFDDVHPDSIKNDKLIWHQCNLLDAGQQEKIIASIKPTHLLHFAWYTVHRKYWTATENLNWVQASLDLFKNFAENNGKRAVSAGTCAEYDWSHGFCSEKNTPLKPATLYGACKNGLQEILTQYTRNSGVSFVWGRIFFLYGPYENSERLIPYVINSLLKNQIAQCSHGNQIRDFLHVEDVASAFTDLLESNVTEAVNIASGIQIKIKDLVYKIAQKLDKTSYIKLGEVPASENEPAVLYADVSRLKDEVGWKPKYDIDSGLEQTIEWWKKHLND